MKNSMHHILLLHVTLLERETSNTSFASLNSLILQRRHNEPSGSDSRHTWTKEKQDIFWRAIGLIGSKHTKPVARSPHDINTGCGLARSSRALIRPHSPPRLTSMPAYIPDDIYCRSNSVSCTVPLIGLHSRSMDGECCCCICKPC